MLAWQAEAIRLVRILTRGERIDQPSPDVRSDANQAELAWQVEATHKALGKVVCLAGKEWARLNDRRSSRPTHRCRR